MRTELRIKRVDLKCIIVAFLICIFSTTSSLIFIIAHYSIMRLFLAVAGFGLQLFFLTYKQKLSSRDIPYVILAILMCLVTIRNNEMPLYRMIVFWSAITLSFFTARFGQVRKYIVGMSLLMYFFYAFWTIFLYFNKSFYLNHVVGLFPETKNRLINWYNQGCMSGLTEHYSTNAMFLATGVIIMIMIFVETRKKRDLFLLGFLTIALLMTGKRAHLLFTAAAVYGTYYFSMVKKDPIKKFAKLILIVLVIVLTIVLAIQFVPALAVGITRILDLFNSDSAGDDQSVATRFELWKLAIREFKKHPILGIGWKQFKGTISVERFSNYSFDTHNVFLQLLCETGVIGFAFYTTWFITMLIKSLRVYKYMMRTNCVPHDKVFINFALCFELFFLMYCFTGNPLYDFMTNVPYFFSCGIIMYYDRTYCPQLNLIKRIFKSGDLNENRNINIS